LPVAIVQTPNSDAAKPVTSVLWFNQAAWAPTSNQGLTSHPIPAPKVVAVLPFDLATPSRPLTVEPRLN
jgi:hypothetical protein